MSVVNIALIALLLFLLARPGGVVSSGWASWSERREERQEIKAAWADLIASESRLGGPQIGSAPWVIVFSDYECPFCLELDRTLRSLAEEYPTMSVVWRHLPLAMHAYAREAAIVSTCASHQGSFESVHRILFDSQPWTEAPDWISMARTGGVENLDAFARCLVEPGAGDLVNSDMVLAQRLNVRVTPTLFFSHGHRANGTMNRVDLLGELDRARRSSLKAERAN